ncbi:MAG: phosphatase PAP2 family protein, partial [Candidatus Omnitrophica bacterium]|nr:phosphatase PAP2 family protein [Candidatus Omnitrophota bacterium]
DRSDRRSRSIGPRNDFKWVFAWLGLTVFAIPFDRVVYNWSWMDPHGLTKDALSVVEYMSGYPIHLLILSILFSCWNRRDLIKGYLLIMIGQGVICDLVKILVGRARPGFGNGPFHFEPFSFSMDMTSFPSGDACAAMALATLLGFYFPRSKWMFWVLGLTAALARVARGRHFLSDVFFGAGFGFLIAQIIFCLLGQRYFLFQAEGERTMNFATND